VEWVKTTAKTLPEAIDLALDNLGVDESEAEIVVVEEPRQGLFGRMRGTARVEARVKPKAIRPKNERSRNRKQGGRKNDRNKNRSKNRSGEGGNGQGRNNDRNNNDRNNNDRNGGGNSGGKNSGGRGSGKGRSDGRQRNEKAQDSGDAVEGQNGQRNNRGKSGGRDRSAGGEGRQRRSKAQGKDVQDMKPKEESPVEDVAEHLETFLTGLTEAFGFDSAVSIESSEEDGLVGHIEGQHGLLVGPKGRTLDAVQELARISCQRTVPSSVRIKVDVGGYRQKRIEALQAFAAKAADSAVEGSSEVALEPMSPADRKAIHDALSEDDRVETRSVGSEPRRKVLVIPVVDEVDEDDDVDTGTDVADESANGSAEHAEDNGASDADAGELVDAADED
jgi:spoIIIJ-associated protein